MLQGLAPGDQLLRREVHERFGGRRQGGISPSRAVPAVMFFTDPAKGHRHGYYDGWDSDGFLHYVGEGQTGDQRFVQGNKAVLEHREDGRTLEGFKADGPEVTYLGEFELIDTYMRDAHETGDPTTQRQVIVFRLRPLNEVPIELPATLVTPKREATVDNVAVEEQHTERGFISPDREEYEFERLEAELVNRYRRFLQAQGHIVSRLRIVPAGEGAPLYSDLWDETALDLIEAKGNVTRDAIRLAVGQLLDYGRFVEAKKRSVLLPSRPRDDLLSYLSSVGIDPIYQDGDDWVREDLNQN